MIKCLYQHKLKDADSLVTINPRRRLNSSTSRPWARTGRHMQFRYNEQVCKSFTKLWPINCNDRSNSKALLFPTKNQWFKSKLVGKVKIHDSNSSIFKMCQRTLMNDFYHHPIPQVLHILSNSDDKARCWLGGLKPCVACGTAGSNAPFSAYGILELRSKMSAKLYIYMWWGPLWSISRVWDK